jgi:thioredoxin 1
VSEQYQEESITRAALDQSTGIILLEFGADWCPHCQAIQPAVARLLKQYPTIQHYKIADGAGKPLGRSFRVKLWPNFVVLKDGSVIAQQARPTTDELHDAIRQANPTV